MKVRKQTRIWTTKYGQRIRICDMTDEHINNTLNMLKRIAIREYRNFIAMGNLFAEGTVAEDDFERDQLYSTIEDFLPEIYDNFILEQERRKY